MDQKDRALPILEHAVQLEPTDSTAHYRLAVLYREKGRTADAKRELAEFQKYRRLKEQLRGIYKELRIPSEPLSSDPIDEKHP
jgi:DNA-binding SARP family transcriptional activator